MKTKQQIYTLPDCKICNNTRRMPFDDEVYGRRMKACSCTAYKAKLTLLKRSLIPDNYIGFEFQDFKTTYPELKEEQQANKNTLDNLQALVLKHERLINKNIDILISGPKTSGKTLLATAFLKQLILTSGYSGLYLTSDQLILTAIESTKYSQQEKEFDFDMRDIENADFLVIDSFEKLTNNSLPSMARVVITESIHKRKAQKRPIILTSTLDYQTLTKENHFASEMIYTMLDFKIYGRAIKDVRQNLIKDLLGGSNDA